MKGLGILVLVLMCFSLSVRSETVTLASGEWKPFLSQSLPNNGIVAQVVKEAFDLEGINVLYEYYPWARAESLSSVGKVDGTLIWSKNQKREQYHLYSAPVMKISIHFFYHQGNPLHWDTLKDLVGRNIGITRSYAYGVDLLNAIKSGELKGEEATSDEQNLQKLVKGRIDLFPMHKEVGLYLIQNELSPEERKKLTYHPKPLTELDYHLMISKNTVNGPELIHKFNRGLSKLRKSGRYKTLVDQRYDWINNTSRVVSQM